MFKYFFSLILIGMLFMACDKDEVADLIIADGTRTITIIAPVHGLGDMGYNDNALSGIISFAESHSDSIQVNLISPLTDDMAQAAVKQWMEKISEASRKGQSRLLVLCSGSYSALVDQYQNLSLPQGQSVLLFESSRRNWPDNVAAFDIDNKEIHRVAGQTLTYHYDTCRIAAVVAYQTDSSANAAIEHLRYGLGPNGQVDVYSLSDTEMGYYMADSAYCLAWRLQETKKYDFTYPLCGGSALGLYRFGSNRTPPIGMDVDCSMYCLSLRFSVIRKVDQALKYYLNGWWEDGALPESRHFGLESGYVEIMNNHNRSTYYINWHETSLQFMH